MNTFSNIIKESANLWLEVSPYLLFGMFVAGLLHIFLGKDFISRHLGRGGFLSILKATLFGIPLPVCSCGVIPLASGLRKDGAHKSSVLSFLVSTPTTGVDSIAATYSLLGPLFMVFRFLGSLFAGLTVGIFDYMFEGHLEKKEPKPYHQHAKIPVSFKLSKLLSYSFLEIPRDIGKWLIFGTVIGGVIAAVIPEDIFLHFLSFPKDFAIALLIGIPLYVCATGSIPIAVSLIAKGFSPGAGLVFLIVGPATNAITLSFVRTKLGKRSFYIYLTSIVFVAVLLGLVFNYVWAHLSGDTLLLTPAGKMIPLIFKKISGIILFGIIIFSFMKRKGLQFAADLEIIVGDIHCGNCKISLESSLKKVDGIEAVRVDEENKKIAVKGSITQDALCAVIREAGYHPIQERF
jgi:uncharacterized protein